MEKKREKQKEIRKRAKIRKKENKQGKIETSKMRRKEDIVKEK